MKILHVARLLGSNTNGIDYVVQMLIIEQNKLNGIIATSLNTSEDSLLKSLKLFNTRDLIVFHSLYCSKSWIFMLYCMLHKIPYIIFPHSGLTISSFQKSKYLKKIVISLFLKKVIYNAAAVHFLSEIERSNSYDFFSRSFIIPNGFNVHHDLIEISEKRYIAYLGRYDINHKGIDLLLDAIQLVQDEIRKHQYTIIMHGYDPKGISVKFINDFVAKNNLSDLIFVCGPITNSVEKINFLSNASAYILTSRYEGLPITILEALSVNTPCLVSTGTNMSDLIEENGFGISCTTSVEGVKKMLMEFMMEENKNSFSPSRAFLINNFSWDTINLRLVSEYKKAINYDK